MNHVNYVVQFRYNGKEYSVPANSDQFFSEPKAGTNDIILGDHAANVAKDYLERNGLRKEGCHIEQLRMYGKNGELIYEAPQE